jgi:hypothetical protein
MIFKMAVMIWNFFKRKIQRQAFPREPRMDEPDPHIAVQLCTSPPGAGRQDEGMGPEEGTS